MISRRFGHLHLRHDYTHAHWPDQNSTRLTMRISLDKQWTARLLNLPETGMGYQRVNISFANNQVAQDMLVFNAEEAEMPESSPRCRSGTSSCAKRETPANGTMNAGALMTEDSIRQTGS
jgi:hypothetical protein